MNLFLKKFNILFFILLFLTSCGQKRKEVRIDSSDVYPVDYSDLEHNRWRLSDFPLVVEVPVDFYEEYEDEFISAAAVWNNALKDKLKTDVILFSPTNIPNTQWQDKQTSLKDNIFGFYSINDIWKLSDSNTLAITSFSFFDSINLMVHADFMFNFHNHSFSKNPTFSEFDFQSVLIHEIGHFLGLKHVSRENDNASVMNPFISSGTQKRVLSEKDLELINFVYEDE